MRKIRKIRKMYEVVTNDNLQLPVCIGTLEECSAYVGIKPGSAKRQMSSIKGGYLKANKMPYRIMPLNFTDEVAQA